MQPIFSAKPIGSPKALAGALGLSVEVLMDFAKNASKKYTHFEIDKTNGKKRAIASPSHELKIIQKRINRLVFEKTIYPDYLFGGIEGRDYVKNAKTHANAAVLIALDIQDFYPSIKALHVLNIFKYFCKFPESVAQLLVQLTTLNDVVPQGACTSSHIANLVFFDVEHKIVREFRQQKLNYSRLLDDMCVSSKSELNPKTITTVIEKVSAVLKTRSLKLKKSKTRISSSTNPQQLMEVTGLWLNRGRPRVKRAERSDIRSALHRCENSFVVSRTDENYHFEHDRLSGRVAKLTYLGHTESHEYRDRLRKILPYYGPTDITKTLKLVSVMERASTTDRGKFSYINKYNQLFHRINILSRSHFLLARTLRSRLSNCSPTSTLEKIIYES